MQSNLGPIQAGNQVVPSSITHEKPLTPNDPEKGSPPAAEGDPNLVEFAHPFDHDNPKDWSTKWKWTVTSVVSATAFLRITSSTIAAPAIGLIAADLEMSSIEAQMAMSVYLLASAFGPLVLSPLSEMYGRQHVLHASNVWFLVWNLVCGFARSKGELIAARCLAGFGGSVAYALGSAVMGDIWRIEQRGHSLAIYLLIPLLGVAIGPICGGVIAEYLSWQWVFFILSIAQGVMVLASFFMFKESHAPTILHRRAKHLRKTTTNKELYTATERLNAGLSVIQVLKNSLTRPLRMLAFHPIVQLISLLQAFEYGLLYIMLTSYASLWTDVYRESVAQSGLHYFAPALGEVIATVIGGKVIDFAFKKLRHRADGVWQPEYRLPLMVPGTLLAPMGLVIYGWCARYKSPWPAVDLGVWLYCAAAQLAGQSLSAYVIDAYPEHTGSATAASQFLRSLTAFAFPLFTPTLFGKLGYGWGNSLLAFLSLAIGIPVPICLWVYGKKLRERAGSTH